MSSGETAAAHMPGVVPGRQSAAPSGEPASVPVKTKMASEPRHVPAPTVSTVAMVIVTSSPRPEPETMVSAMRSTPVMMPDMVAANMVVPVDVSPVTKHARVGVAATERQTQHEHEQVN
jgi:hypothetical protein